jgi:hypothetical protein
MAKPLHEHVSKAYEKMQMGKLKNIIIYAFPVVSNNYFCYFDIYYRSGASQHSKPLKSIHRSSFLGISAKLSLIFFRSLPPPEVRVSFAPPGFYYS